MTTAFFSFAIGALLTWTGWRHWRYRNQETISLLEATVLKVTGDDPLPSTRVDRILTYVQAFLGLALGAFFLVIGIIGFLVEVEML